ncbi:uncharacterized protein [Vicugna pacos]|uniref:Basic proline-rich protein-like n=1 Tax=Vicugna pacos TaxID=30538 RepID=A0ABM5DGV1_VICPA
MYPRPGPVVVLVECGPDCWWGGGVKLGESRVFPDQLPEEERGLGSRPPRVVVSAAAARQGLRRKDEGRVPIPISESNQNGSSVANLPLPPAVHEPFKPPAPRGTRRSRLAELDQRPWAGPAPTRRSRVPPPRSGCSSRPAGAHARSPHRKESAHTPGRPSSRAAAASPVLGGLSARRDSKSCGRQGAVRTQGGCGGAGLWKMPAGGASVRCSPPPPPRNPVRPPGNSPPTQGVPQRDASAGTRPTAGCAGCAPEFCTELNQPILPNIRK